MRLVVGLRNPGSEYEGTRHNVGFEVVDRMAGRSGERWGRGRSRLRSQVVVSGAGSDRVILASPLGSMNESGGPVRRLLDYYSVLPEDLLVVHDDIDLPFGRLRLQVGGGSGGHNGIRSIEGSLGTSEFNRLKVGVGRPPGSMDPAVFVLRRFSKAEREEVDILVEDAADVAERWCTDRASAQEMAALRGKG
ncbi:MAG: aminoacyl-tRNA hydrolase [Acidimicrobiia bacterium]